jgi:hypothetical protein
MRNLEVESKTAAARLWEEEIEVRALGVMNRPK